VVTVAAPSTVTASRTTHSREVPRHSRDELAAKPASNSGAETNEDESLCHKSELAIRDAQTPIFKSAFSADYWFWLTNCENRGTD
jgi:hypothetical protein